VAQSTILCTLRRLHRTRKRSIATTRKSPIRIPTEREGGRILYLRQPFSPSSSFRS